MQKENTIAFLIHPINIDIIRKNFSLVYNNLKFCQPLIDCIPVRILKKVYSSFMPHRFLEFKNIVSAKGNKLNLIIIMLPLFPSQLILGNQRIVLKKIVDSVKLAERLGAKLIALGGFTSIVGNQGQAVFDSIQNSKIALTTGNTLTASLSISGILKAAELLKKQTSDSSILIVGATGDIGCIVAKVLAPRFKKIVLMSRQINEENKVYQEVKNLNNNTFIVNKLSAELITESDFIFLATSSVQAILDPKCLKKRTIVADVSIPSNIEPFARNDIFVFEAGKAKLSFYENVNSEKFKFLFPKNSIYGCLAEALILGFEEKFENYSIGRGEITKGKIEEIETLGKEHGIVLSDFSYGNDLYSEDTRVR
jgi:predicted amino acid dehydrogenase